MRAPDLETGGGGPARWGQGAAGGATLPGPPGGVHCWAGACCPMLFWLGLHVHSLSQSSVCCTPPSHTSWQHVSHLAVSPHSMCQKPVLTVICWGSSMTKLSLADQLEGGGLRESP